VLENISKGVFLNLLRQNRSREWCNNDETYDIWHCNTNRSTGFYHAWWHVTRVWQCYHHQRLWI